MFFEEKCELINFLYSQTTLKYKEPSRRSLEYNAKFESFFALQDNAPTMNWLAWETKFQKYYFLFFKIILLMFTFIIINKKNSKNYVLFLVVLIYNFEIFIFNGKWLMLKDIYN